MRLQLDRAIVEDGRFVTSGAIAASLPLALRLIEREASRELARTVARLMLLDPEQPLQAPFMRSNEPGIYTDAAEAGGGHVADDLVRRACALIAKSLAEPPSIERLAAQLHVTPRTLLRRFRRALDVSPLGYVQSVRVERARTLLETTRLPIKRIADRLGYLDESAFRRLFRRHLGIAMSEYRRRFGSSRRGPVR